MNPIAFRSLLCALLASAAGIFGFTRYLDSGLPPGVGKLYLDRDDLREQSQIRRGREAAERAIASGQLRLLAQGPVSPTVVRLAKERFGIVLEPSGACFEPLSTDSYNEVMNAHLAGLFGPDWFESCRREEALEEPAPCPTPPSSPRPPAA